MSGRFRYQKVSKFKQFQNPFLISHTLFRKLGKHLKFLKDTNERLQLLALIILKQLTPSAVHSSEKFVKERMTFTHFFRSLNLQIFK